MLSRNDSDAAALITQMYHERRTSRAKIFNDMEQIRKHYYGEIVVPLPELDDAEKPAVANLIYQGIEQFSLRAASTMPDIKFPAIKPGFQYSEDRARKRRLAALGWLDMNRMNHKMRRRARHLVAYGASVVTLSPVSMTADDKRRIPFWQIRDPLSAYPATTVDPDNVHPEDCIFHSHQTLGWLKRNFPAQAAVLRKGDKAHDGTLITILEYMDALETVTIAVGESGPLKEKQSLINPQTQDGVASQVMLTRIHNRAEVSPVVYGGRMGLDRQAGMFDQMTGMYQRAAKLDALQTIAVFRNVFPDEWVQSIPNAPGKPRITIEADGRTGQRGVIENGTINIVHLQPGSTSGEALDRLERNARVTGSLPAELGGESSTNIRTARRGESVMSSAIDMPMAEVQEILAASLEEEIRIGVRIAKAYYGSEPKTFYMGSDGKVTAEDYVPDTDFETDICAVAYSIPGADINGMVVATGQLVGTEVLSKQTAMEMIPWVEDPIRERDQIELEGLRRATLAGLEQQASQGQLDPMTLAKVAMLKAKSHLPIEEALMKVHADEQEKQAQQAQDQMGQQQMGQPPMGPSPDQMPGLVQPPPGQEGAAPPTIAPPTEGQGNLQALLSALHQGAPAGGGGQMPAPAGAMGMM